MQGDTLYIRGGVYYPVGVTTGTFTIGVNVDDIDGTAANRICVFNYPGEKPILDGSQMVHQDDWTLGIYIDDSEYWHFKGLTIRNVEQEDGENAATGIWSSVTSHTIYEEMICYQIGGTGFKATVNAGTSTTGNKYLNCDSYDNYDPYTDPAGGDADGYHYQRNFNLTDSTIFIGCRAWNNSDDGYDGWETEGIIVYQDCWAFNNGYQSAGNGVGFKLGGSDSAVSSTYIRQLYNCIAFGNKKDGIDENGTAGLIKVLNFTSYKNDVYGINWSGADEASIYRNIISYDNGTRGYDGNHAVKTHDFNSYEENRAEDGVIVSDADFVSLDSMQLYRPRKFDGSLPDIDFLKLDPQSGLVDAGIDVGLVYNGYAPDVGAMESNSSSISRNDEHSGNSTTALNGTNIISGGSKSVNIVSVSANRIVWLPYASAETIGTIINGLVGSNGIELRPYFTQVTTVYINNVTTNVEALVPGSHSFTATQIDATHWVLRAWTNLGAEITPIVPDAI